MTASKGEENPSESRRKEIFQALVEVQDRGVMSVPQSRQWIAEHYGVTERQIRSIEDEGMDQQWPPL